MVEAHYDIVIVGAGIVGLAMANELVDSPFSVALVDRQSLDAVDESVDVRVSAINPSALNRFRELGVMEAPLADRVCAFDHMCVWDQTGAGQIAFDAAESGISELGAIIENRVLQNLLLARVEQADNIELLLPAELRSIRYSELEPVSPQLEIHLPAPAGETRLLHAKLLIGADGIKSKVREAAMIPRHRENYRQQALVCNVTTSEPHHDTAWQCFMPSGPLAFLPLFNGDCSIVWSLDDAAAAEVMALPDDAFMQALSQASQYRLGDVVATGKRYLYPLSHGHVTEYVKPGLALIGDAAHNIHPLAGQGANLGIADAITLFEVIDAARSKGRHWYSLETLQRYQRRRKASNTLMETAMTGFKQLFGQSDPFISELRNAGLSLVDHLPLIKNSMIKIALGQS
jgi:2-octaprenylphenol hydroxylase